MNLKVSCSLAIVSIFYFLSACSGKQTAQQEAFLPAIYSEEEFMATGNTDPEHRAENGKRGEVVVTFDLLPTRMSFCLPSFPCLVTENNIHYYNGWTETYDEAAGDGSCEPLMDWDNVYNRMWIESQNDARIVVRWRGALTSSDGIIAHKDAPQVAPYGPGDWVDESYIIYPDGVHVRHSKIYTYYAPTSQPFGWDRDPPNYIFEFQEMLFLGSDSHMPEDDIQTNALTLVKMNGDNTTVSYDPYPIHFDPDEEDLYRSFGDFWNANMFVVNTKSEYHPFTIGRTEGVSISPYAPERKRRKHTFQSWPQEPDPDEGYHGVALGHIIHRTLYNKTETTISQIYLSGFTNSPEPHKVVAPLARSWLQAPELALIDSGSGKNHGYDAAQRAYLLEIDRNADFLEFDLGGSEESPIINPAFLVRNWGAGDVLLELDDKAVEKGAGFRIGHYDLLKMEGWNEWNDILVVWIQHESNNPVNIKLIRN